VRASQKIAEVPPSQILSIESFEKSNGLAIPIPQELATNAMASKETVGLI